MEQFNVVLLPLRISPAMISILGAYYATTFSNCTILPVTYSSSWVFTFCSENCSLTSMSFNLFMTSLCWVWVACASSYISIWALCTYSCNILTWSARLFPASYTVLIDPWAICYYPTVSPMYWWWVTTVLYMLLIFAEILLNAAWRIT